MNLRESILHAARADAIPASVSGLWTVCKFSLTKEVNVADGDDGKRHIIPAGHYTQLWRFTQATMHTKYGVLVMQDTPQELHTHLDFMMRAYGRVLITGLGLGCALRGCLANPRVKHVVVIERDYSVLKLVTPYLPTGLNYSIVVADAREWVKNSTGHFDCVWHDLWSDEDKGEPHLQLTHANLLAEMAGRSKFQGAWNFPREHRRLWRRTIKVI